jgi:hypothetical protein
MRFLEIELLWWEGCPSTQRARDELEAALRDVGLDDVEIRMREIRTDEEAIESPFAGSPTILIDGVDALAALDSPIASEDPQDVVADAPVGLSCRVYRRRDGRISPTPDPDDLRAALQRAASQPEVTR